MNPIFITGRFCSGTTFLWNFFNWSKHYCAYYEALHEGLLESIQYIVPKKQHNGVSNYWEEYHSLTDLNRFYSSTFAFERLALQENESHEPLKNYLHYLTQKKDDRQVAIKLNRIDFRLPWIAKNFPDAKIINIKRNTRDSWKSSRAHLPKEYERDMFQFNAYGLVQLAISLDEFFPFIIDTSTSSYHLHYFISKLSEQFARHHAHTVIEFEKDIVENFDNFIEKIASTTGLNKNEISDYQKIKITPELKKYSTEEIEWLESVEKECDSVLDHLGINNMSPQQILNSKFPTLYPEKRKIFSNELLASHYQLEKIRISLQGQLDIERETPLLQRIHSSLKRKLYKFRFYRKT